MNAISWTYVILAEFVNARSGLGYIIQLAGNHLKPAQVFVGHPGHRRHRPRHRRDHPRLEPRALPLARDGCRSAAAPATTDGQTPKLELQRSPHHLPLAGRATTSRPCATSTSTIADKPGVGEIVVFLGPSGCGKSTILKAVAGLLAARRRARSWSTASRSTGIGRDRGMVFQTYTSFGWLTVRENVEYGLELQGVPEAERASRPMRYLEEVGLKDFADAVSRRSSRAA